MKSLGHPLIFLYLVLAIILGRPPEWLDRLAALPVLFYMAHTITFYQHILYVLSSPFHTAASYWWAITPWNRDGGVMVYLGLMYYYSGYKGILEFSTKLARNAVPWRLRSMVYQKQLDNRLKQHDHNLQIPLPPTARPDINVTVKAQGVAFVNLQVHPFETVASIKEKISDVTGVTACDLVLHRNGQALPDRLTLARLNITTSCDIHVSNRDRRVLLNVNHLLPIDWNAVAARGLELFFAPATWLHHHAQGWAEKVRPQAWLKGLVESASSFAAWSSAQLRSSFSSCSSSPGCSDDKIAPSTWLDKVIGLVSSPSARSSAEPSAPSTSSSPSSSSPSSTSSPPSQSASPASSSSRASPSPSPPQAPRVCMSFSSSSIPVSRRKCRTTTFRLSYSQPNTPFIVFDKLDPKETVGQVVRDAAYLQGMNQEVARSARLHLGKILSKDDTLKTAGLTINSHPLVIVMGLGGGRTSRASAKDKWSLSVNVSRHYPYTRSGDWQTLVNVECSPPGGAQTFRIPEQILPEEMHGGRRVNEAEEVRVKGDLQAKADAAAATLSPTAGVSEVCHALAIEKFPIASAENRTKWAPLPRLDRPDDSLAIRVTFGSGGTKLSNDFGEWDINIVDSDIFIDLDTHLTDAMEYATQHALGRLAGWKEILESTGANSDELYLHHVIAILFVTIVDAHRALHQEDVHKIGPLELHRDFINRLQGERDGLGKVRWSVLRLGNGRLDVRRWSRNGLENKSYGSTMAAWVEAGNDEEDYDDAYEESFAEARKIIGQANADRSEVTLEEMWTKMEGGRIAPRLNRSGGGGTLPSRGQLCTLKSNTRASRSTAADVEDLDVDAVCKMLSARCSKVVAGEVIVRSEYSGAIIAVFPTDLMTYKEYKSYLKKHHGGSSNISLEHEFQHTAVERNGTIEHGFSVSSNFLVVSVFENLYKHRYPPTVFGFLLLLLAHDAKYPDWQLGEDADEHGKIVAFILTALSVCYRPWDMPCPRPERFRLALHRLHSTRKDQEASARSFKVHFARPTTLISSVIPDNKNLEAFLRDSEAKFSADVARALLGLQGMEKFVNLGELGLAEAFLADLVTKGYISKSKINAALNTVRPPSYEDTAVGLAAANDLRRVGKSLVQELGHLGVDFVLNGDGIPSLHPLGLDSADQITRALEKTRPAAKKTFGGSQLTPAQLYANHLCSKVDRALKSNMPEAGGRVKLRLTSWSADSLPFQLPYLNKSALSPSASRWEHGDTQYRTGFAKTRSLDDLTFTNWSATRATFALDSWALNSGLRGEQEQQEQILQKERAAALYWATEGEGQEMADLFGVKDGVLSREKAEVLIEKMREVIMRNPHLKGDKVEKMINGLEDWMEAQDWDVEMEAASRARLSKRAIPSRTFVRPSIVLYEEPSPAASSIGSISISDLSSSPDLLIVAGTSLRIPGFKKLVKEFSKAVRSKGGIAVFVNREEMTSQEWKGVFDYQVIGNSDDFSKRVVADWKSSRPRDWVKQKTLEQSLGFSTGKKAVVAAGSKKPSSPSASRPPLRDIANLPKPKPPVGPFSAPNSPRKRSSTTSIDSPSPKKRSSPERTPTLNTVPLPARSPSTRKRATKTTAQAPNSPTKGQSPRGGRVFAYVEVPRSPRKSRAV